MRTGPDRRRPSTRGRIPRRNIDRLEDAVVWLLTSLALLTVLLAILTGAGLHADSLDRMRTQTADRTPVRAVLLESAVVSYGPDGSATPIRVPARWAGPGGVEHTGSVAVSEPRPAGAEVTAWTDRSGAVVSAPITPDDAAIIAMAGGVAVLIGGWLGLSVVWFLVRRWIATRNAAAWAAEWALVEPDWSGRR